ncbi:MAG: plastocyanin/azurin family copper-binding protein [Vicinamibacterales bacterium]
MRAYAALLIVTFGAAAAAPAGPEVRTLRGIVHVAGRPAKDVVVWLDDAGPIRPASHTVVLDQRNLEFRPRLLVVAVGTTVEMPNSDRVFHNVFSFHNGKRFDLGLYPAGTRRSVTFDQAGVSRVFCNIHPTMAAYVIAVPSSRFAVTDAHGRFAIDQVAGDRIGYSLWRAGADPHAGVLTASDAPVTLEWR